KAIGAGVVPHIRPGLPRELKLTRSPKRTRVAALPAAYATQGPPSERGRALPSASYRPGPSLPTRQDFSYSILHIIEFYFHSTSRISSLTRVGGRVPEM